MENQHNDSGENQTHQPDEQSVGDNNSSNKDNNSDAGDIVDENVLEHDEVDEAVDGTANLNIQEGTQAATSPPVNSLEQHQQQHTPPQSPIQQHTPSPSPMKQQSPVTQSPVKQQPLQQSPFQFQQPQQPQQAPQQLQQQYIPGVVQFPVTVQQPTYSTNYPSASSQQPKFGLQPQQQVASPYTDFSSPTVTSTVVTSPKQQYQAPLQLDPKSQIQQQFQQLQQLPPQQLPFQQPIAARQELASNNAMTSNMQWSNSSNPVADLGTKNNPLQINEFAKVLNRVYTLTGTSGAQSSTHYPVRLLKEGNYDIISKDTTVPLPFYYVDVMADISQSRLSSQSLKSSGYYELKCSPKDVDPSLIPAIQSRIEFLKQQVGKGETRLPLYLDGENNARFGPRLFEFYSGKNKDKESMEIFVNETLDNNSTMRKVGVNSQDYKSHTGKVRVVGNFSTITVANGYVKLVFTARMLVLASSAVHTIGGVQGSKQNTPSGVNVSEWNDLVATLREYVDSGIPVHMIKSSLSESLDNKIKVASSDNTYQAMSNVYGAQQSVQQLPQQFQPPQFQQPLQQQQTVQQQPMQQPMQQPIQQVAQQPVQQSVQQLPQQFQYSQQFQQPQQSQYAQQFQQPQQLQYPQQLPQQFQAPQQFQQQLPQQFQPPSYPPMSTGKAVPQYKRL